MRRRNISKASAGWSDLFDQAYGERTGSFDGMILGVTIALTLSGLIMVFSASGVKADSAYSESTFFLQRQGMWLGVGFLIMFLIARLDYTVLKPLTPYLLGGCMILLVLVLVFGLERNFARRWLGVPGLAFQPSELSKLAVVLYLASYLAKPGLRITEWRSGFLPPVIIVGVFCGLIVVEPDLGSAVVLGMVLVSMLFLGGARLLHVVGICSLSIPVIGGLIWQSPERMERIMSFLDPAKVSKGSGWQLDQSFLALQNGGVFGVGLAQGNQKLFYLPEVHTDFVLAMVGEELGLVGTTVLMLLFAALVLKGFRIAAQAPDLLGRHLALGVTLLLGIQVLINAGVVCGLLPTKGLTLPLVSYGGSSLLTSMMAIGILLSVARQRVVKM